MLGGNTVPVAANAALVCWGDTDAVLLWQTGVVVGQDTENRNAGSIRERVDPGGKQRAVAAKLGDKNAPNLLAKVRRQKL